MLAVSASCSPCESFKIVSSSELNLSPATQLPGRVGGAICLGRDRSIYLDDEQPRFSYRGTPATAAANVKTRARPEGPRKCRRAIGPGVCHHASRLNSSSSSSSVSSSKVMASERGSEAT